MKPSKDILKYKYKNKKQREKAVNRQDTDHMTPLHYAAKYAQYDAAKTLINMNADPTIKGDDGCLPLHFAVKYRPEAFRPLVKSQSDPENDIPNENEFEGKPEIRNKEEDFLKTLEFLIQARALQIQKIPSKFLPVQDKKLSVLRALNQRL